MAVPLAYATPSQYGNRGLIPPFRSPTTLGLIASIALAVCGLVQVVSAVLLWLQYQLLERATQGQLPTPTEAQTNDLRIMVVNIGYVLCVIGTAIAFLMWLFRAQESALARCVSRTLRRLGGRVVVRSFR
ncbi:MAG: hypothetical protein QM770_06925 [Tepidisphaeraceae bacterium]